jgi:nicotinate-nucleotide--dimethylbenzimidazole phosphoribosyltransferase
MQQFKINSLDRKLVSDLQKKIDLKTKPTGSLGRLESIALQIGLIQKTLSPDLKNPTILIFAGDHGVTEEGVSPYPQEVTYQMVYNFLQGGAAINVFCRQNQITEVVVDAGVNHTFKAETKLIPAKIGYGTANFLKSAAMSLKDAALAIMKGSEIVEKTHEKGCNIIGFGEMGIGNTSSASAIIHTITELPLSTCVGAGTGLSTTGINHKMEIIKKAIAHHRVNTKDGLEVLATFGGFEIAMMCGAYLKAAEMGMIILVDGFIATSGLLIAQMMHPAVLDYCIFSHVSHEKGHQAVCNYLQTKPILNLEMRLGEGTGAALAYPLVKAAVTMLNQMASFEDAGVANKSE